MNDIEKDISDRKSAFIKEYGKLRQKYQMDFASFPMWVPEKEGMFVTVMNTDVVDQKYRPVKSPLAL